MLGINGQDFPVNMIGLCQATRSVMVERLKNHVLNERRLLATHAPAHLSRED
jgi:hypothetical protein